MSPAGIAYDTPVNQPIKLRSGRDWDKRNCSPQRDKQPDNDTVTTHLYPLIGLDDQQLANA